ncbi:MAG: two-component regulator propeller domain-containing protein, partial [Salibacteraceae bacterium]
MATSDILFTLKAYSWRAATNSMLLVLLCCAGAALFGVAKGQSPYYRQFTVDDGLPSNEVYQVRVQSNGTVWFATDRGIARFDGNKFDAFTQNHGLADPTTIVMTEDPAGNMWFGTLSGRLFIMQGDCLVPHPQNALLDSI